MNFTNSTYTFVMTKSAHRNTDKIILHMTFQATSVFAADAVARLSGTVGVAAVTAGPGML